MKRLFLFLLIVVVFGCDDSEEKKTCYISKIETAYGAARYITYDIFYTDGKISAIRATLHTLNDQTQTYFLTWDGDRLSYVMFEPDGSSYEDHFYYTYGETTSTLTYYQISGGDTTSTYTQEEFYMDEIQDGTYYYNGTVYEVVGKNVVRSAAYEEVGNEKVIDPDSYINFDFDEHPNTLRQLIRLPNVLMLGFITERINSTNNLTQATYASNGLKKNYEFTYDEKGNILNITDVNTGRLMAFSYECK
jgi:hypothetical protein